MNFVCAAKTNQPVQPDTAGGGRGRKETGGRREAGGGGEGTGRSFKEGGSMLRARRGEMEGRKEGPDGEGSPSVPYGGVSSLHTGTHT